MNAVAISDLVRNAVIGGDIPNRGGMLTRQEILTDNTMFDRSHDQGAVMTELAARATARMKDFKLDMTISDDLTWYPPHEELHPVYLVDGILESMINREMFCNDDTDGMRMSAAMLYICILEAVQFWKITAEPINVPAQLPLISVEAGRMFSTYRYHVYAIIIFTGYCKPRQDPPGEGDKRSTVGETTFVNNIFKRLRKDHRGFSRASSIPALICHVCFLIAWKFGYVYFRECWRTNETIHDGWLRDLTRRGLQGRSYLTVILNMSRRTKHVPVMKEVFSSMEGPLYDYVYACIKSGLLGHPVETATLGSIVTSSVKATNAHLSEVFNFFRSVAKKLKSQNMASGYEDILGLMPIRNSRSEMNWITGTVDRVVQGLKDVFDPSGEFKVKEVGAADFRSSFWRLAEVYVDLLEDVTCLQEFLLMSSRCTKCNIRNGIDHWQPMFPAALPGLRSQLLAQFGAKVQDEIVDVAINEYYQSATITIPMF